MGLIVLLLLLLFWWLDKASKQEVEEALNSIENPTQREAVKSLLSDQETLSKLRELAEVA